MSVCVCLFLCMHVSVIFSCFLIAWPASYQQFQGNINYQSSYGHPTFTKWHFMSLGCCLWQCLSSWSLLCSISMLKKFWNNNDHTHLPLWQWGGSHHVLWWTVVKIYPMENIYIKTSCLERCGKTVTEYLLSLEVTLISRGSLHWIMTQTPLFTTISAT